MKTLAIVLGSLVFVGCGSELSERYELDVQLTEGGAYGHFVDNDVRLEFASFEVDPDLFAVTIAGHDFTIDTYYLPPDREKRPLATMAVVLIRQPRGNGGTFGGTFLLPPERRQRPAPGRRYGIFDPATGGGDGSRDIDLGNLGVGLREHFPEHDPAIDALVYVAEHL